MSLTAGTRLGSYEIIGPLGEGGMGEVYRARDTKLKRDVALKILPDAFANDSDRLARFEREAQVLASLNHPHIAQIYGVEGSALVMELVDGEDLSSVIARGPVAVPDALAIARQIATALEAAHEAGIIHRDLKPANIKIKADGTVKVLDFGLAKAIEGDGSRLREQSPSPGLANLPTLTSPAMTALGMILGTAAYMSPEQARGIPVDRRADLWSFGIIVFEMLTGRSMFAGDTVTDVIAAVVTREPEWQALPAAAPPAIRRLLHRCLEKNPKRRLRDAADVGLEIDEAIAESASGITQLDRSAEAGGSRRLTNLGWVGLAGLLFVAGFAIARVVAPPRVEEPLLRLSIARPSPLAIISISPDGQWLAAVDAAIRVRRLTDGAWRELPGTAGVYGEIFWSPDSRQIGFQLGSSLKRIDVNGARAESICVNCVRPEALRGATWNRAGVIVISAGRPGGARVGMSGLWRIAEAGGDIQEATTLDAARGDNSHRFPAFLPDGRRFLYTARRTSGEHGIMMGSLDGTPPRQIALGYSSVAYASGYVLFVRAGTLVGSLFDPDANKPAGDPVTIAERVMYHTGVGTAFFSVSETGRLVVNEETGPRGLGWVDRTGRGLGLVAEGDVDETTRISRDGSRLVVAMMDAGPSSADIYAIDAASGARTRLTTDPGWDQNPVLSPDNKWVIFRSGREAQNALYVRATEGSDPERRLIGGISGSDLLPYDWSPDGKTVLVEQSAPDGTVDLMQLAMPAGARLEPWLVTRANERAARFSPDGHWVAYMSDESGSDQVYVRPFASAVPGRRVTTNGGLGPVWSRQGDALYFLDPTGRMMSIPIHAAGTLTHGAPRTLFDAAPLGNWGRFDVDAAGRFLMRYVEPGPAASRAEIVLNWTRSLKK